MELSKRQKQILSIVEANEPISGKLIAAELGLSRATLRSDLAVLTMLGMLDAKPKVGYYFVTDRLQSRLYENLFEVEVKEIMQPARTVGLDDSVQMAISKIFLEDTGSLYVLDHNKQLAGILSRKDLLRVSISREGSHDYPVAMIMTRMPNIITAFPDEYILDASQKMMNCEIDSLPVVDRQNSRRVIGRVSKTMITHFFTKVGMEYRSHNKSKK